MQVIFLNRDKALLELIASFKETRALVLGMKLSFQEFKEFQIQNNWLNTRPRVPIKLKDIETFVEDYMLVSKRNEGAHGRT